MRTQGNNLISGQTSPKEQARFGWNRGPLLLVAHLPITLVEALIQRLRGSNSSLMRVCTGIVTLLLCCLPAHANTITAASCSQADVQKAITLANTGDTVIVPGGSCSWGPNAWPSAVNIPSNKGITLDGGGAKINSNGGTAIELDANASITSRITNFSFPAGGDSSNATIRVTTTFSPASAPYRIDHNTFGGTSNNGTFISLNFNGPGLIDHNSFTVGVNVGADEMIHNDGMNSGNNSGWTTDVAPGGPNMVFVEDNTFDCDNTVFFCSAVQAYYGARTVVRHNTMTFSQVDQHGTCGQIWARWWEIYDNTFVLPSPFNQSNYVTLRGGSGVIYGNSVTNPGNNQGAGSIQLTDDCNGGYPDAGQVGRGINNALSPSYLWGNDSSMTIETTASDVQQNRDYYVSVSQPANLLRQELSTDNSSTTYNYVAYPYPHPLQGSPNAPSPPTGLTAVAH
jgi:hypothetical protein